MQRKSTIATDRMEELIRSGEWPVGAMVPPVRSLAQSLQISPVTAIQALVELSQRGGVSREPGGRRYRVAGRLGTPQAREVMPSAGAPRHEQVAAELKDEILSGRLTGAVPTGSAVSARFGCSRATARAALASLARMGYVDRVGRQVAVPGTGTPGAHESTVFMTGHPGIALAYSMHALSLVQTLERELQSLGWRPMRYLLSRVPQSASEAPPEHTVTAFIHIMQFDFQDKWVPFFKGYSRVPVVLVDMEEGETPLLQRQGSWTLRLTPDNRHAGRCLAGHMHDRGHRRVALISHIGPEAPWVRRRIEGCEDIFAQGPASKGAGLRVFCAPESSGDPPGTDPVPHSSMNSIQWQLIDAGRLPMDLVKTKIKGVHDLYFQDRAARRMIPLFEEALREATAWICINDEVACRARAFLDSKGAAGRRIAVAGFDNSPESYRLGITSYDFAFDRIGSLALRLVAYPDQALSRGSASRHVQGQLIARRSTAP